MKRKRGAREEIAIEDFSEEDFEPTEPAAAGGAGGAGGLGGEGVTGGRGGIEEEELAPLAVSEVPSDVEVAIRVLQGRFSSHLRCSTPLSTHPNSLLLKRLAE
jgi:hypothetical protein